MIKRKRLIKYGELAKGVLSYFGDVMISGYSSIQGRRGGISPSILIDYLQDLFKSIKTYQEKNKKLLRVLKTLEKKEIFDLQEKDGKVIVCLKDENHPKIVEYSIKSLLDFKKKKKWNRKWFLVFFDVPEVQRNKRDYLRRFLNNLGFYQYQKSVYLFPYECEKEVELIKKIVEGAKYMKYIVAEKIEDEDKAKDHFKLN